MGVPGWAQRLGENITGNIIAFVIVAATAAIWAAMNPIISAPHAWSWPTGIIVLLLILGLLLFVQNQWFAYVEHRQRKQPALVAAPVATTAAPAVKDAELRLHIFGDERQPTRISLHNVWRWYYLRNILAMIDKETGRRVEHIIPSLLFSSTNQWQLERQR